MRPSRSRVTTRPDFGSSGRASARGNRTSTPPCMMGAVIMKMMSSTKATSTSEVTLMSAFRGSSPCPRSPPPPPNRPAITASLRAPRDDPCGGIPLRRDLLGEHHPERFELGRRQRGGRCGHDGPVALAAALHAARLELGEELHALTQQPVVR